MVWASLVNMSQCKFKSFSGSFLSDCKVNVFLPYEVKAQLIE